VAVKAATLTSAAAMRFCVRMVFKVVVFRI
jgi:hypothetical protein